MYAGFKGPILPGILLGSIFPAIIAQHHPGAIYLSQTLKFRTPVLVSSLPETSSLKTFIMHFPQFSQGKVMMSWMSFVLVLWYYKNRHCFYEYCFSLKQRTYSCMTRSILHQKPSLLSGPQAAEFMQVGSNVKAQLRVEKVAHNQTRFSTFCFSDTGHIAVEGIAFAILQPKNTNDHARTQSQ